MMVTVEWDVSRMVVNSVGMSARASSLGCAWRLLDDVSQACVAGGPSAWMVGE